MKSILDWDSQFFGKKISRLTLPIDYNEDEIRELIMAIDCDLCYIFSKNENSYLLKLGAELMDNKVVFQKNVKGSENICEYIHSSGGDVTPELLELALLSGQHSRFKIDKIIGGKFEDLYLLWLERSLKREIADEVFVHEENGSVLGFITVKQYGNFAIIGLIAVSNNSQGKGIGKQLLNAVNNWSIQKGICRIEVATQLRNVQACKFYSSADYKVISTDHIYHYHKKT